MPRKLKCECNLSSCKTCDQRARMRIDRAALPKRERISRDEDQPRPWVRVRIPLAADDIYCRLGSEF